MAEHVLRDPRVSPASNLLSEGVTEVVRMNVLLDPGPNRNPHHQQPERLRRRRAQRVLSPLRVEPWVTEPLGREHVLDRPDASTYLGDYSCEIRDHRHPSLSAALGDV